MKIKHGVIMVGLHVQMWLATVQAAIIWLKYGKILVVTEGVVYRKTGLHPLGRACDYRLNYFDAATRRLVCAELAKALGKDFDVVMHGEGHAIHAHVEYDPVNPKII